MARLIDADALDREMYRKSFEVDDGRNVWNSGLWIRYKIYEEASRDAPTVDAEPVIRCKDCKWHDSGVSALGGTWNTCTVHINRTLNTWEDNYCGWAERKEE